jgi:hypothetical protein
MNTCSSSDSLFGSAEHNCSRTTTTESLLGRPNFTCKNRMINCTSSGTYIFVCYSCRDWRFLGGIAQI